MSIAVGQRQRSNAFGVSGGEDLGDPSSTIVADDIDLTDYRAFSGTYGSSYSY